MSRHDLSESSRRTLDTCHPDLREWAYALAAFLPVEFRGGHRDKATQNRLYAEGKSKLQWPESKHNRTPSEAVHVFLGEIQWEDTRPFYVLYGAGKLVAKARGIKVRWGGDWDRDLDFEDNTFDDLAHWELHHG